MDALLLHHEIETGEFPDCCVRCGAGRTELTPIVLTTAIPIVGGSFQYAEIALPMCREHVKAPIVSLSYPGVRSFTDEGVVVKNLSAEFVEALEEYRERMRERRRRRGEPEPERRRVAQAPPVSPERERAYRIFIVACLVAAVLFGAAIGGIVLLLKSRQNGPPAAHPK